MLGSQPGNAIPGLAAPGMVDSFANVSPTPATDDIFVPQTRSLTFLAVIRPSALNEPGAL